MKEKEAFDLFNKILDDLGVSSGDTLYVGVDMGKLPLPKYEINLKEGGVKAFREKQCEFVYQCLMERLGSNGTLLAPSFSYDYARNGTPYHHETSPSEVGPFTEYLRTRPQAVRSFHPLNSLCGVGKKANEILADAGRAGYGTSSPYIKFNDYQVKFAFIGTPLSELTYVHHLEQLYGVHYMYNKLYNTPAYLSGKLIEGPWLCFVRYLGINVDADLSPLTNLLLEEGKLKTTSHWPHPMHGTDTATVDKAVRGLLDQNPYIFMSQELEVHVEAPGASRQDSRIAAARFVLDSQP